MSHERRDDFAEAGGYPIGMVASLTGLPIDVIRAWERRYGLPSPARSMGGHRLYRPRDVALLRRAAALRAEGITAAAACGMALAEAAQAQAAPFERVVSPLIERLCERLFQAAVGLDAPQAQQVLAEAAAHLDIEPLWSMVLAPTLARVGTAWERGAISAAPEHLLSNVVRGRLSTLLQALPRLAGAPVALIGAAPGERHDLPPLMLALLLGRAGWAVTYLGADTPAAAWEEAVHGVRPRVVVITATLPEHAGAALATLVGLRDGLGARAPHLTYGGPAFRALPDAEGRPEFLHLSGDLEVAVLRLAGLA